LFVFSSRRRHTRSKRDWSSDVCSSDLVEMALIVWIFGVLYQSGKKWIACIVFIILNGIIAPLPFALLLSLPFYISLVPSVLVGSALNGVLALIFIQRFEPFLQKKLVGILNES